MTLSTHPELMDENMDNQLEQADADASRDQKAAGKAAWRARRAAWKNRREQRRAARKTGRLPRRAARKTQREQRRKRRHARQAATPVAGVLAGTRHAALTAIAVLVTAASLSSFAESYRGLYLWALGHSLTGVWAAGFPLQVDTFLAVGELVLFVALVDQWPTWSRWPAWLVTGGGLIISVGGNIGHVAGHELSARLTAAVPPLAAAAALAVGLGVVKRIVAARLPADITPVAADTTVEAVPRVVVPADIASVAPAVGRRQMPPKTPGRTPAQPASGRRTSAEDIREAVLAHPDTPTDELAEKIGRSPRTVRRHRAIGKGSSPGITSSDDSIDSRVPSATGA